MGFVVGLIALAAVSSCLPPQLYSFQQQNRLARLNYFLQNHRLGRLKGDEPVLPLEDNSGQLDTVPYGHVPQQLSAVPSSQPLDEERLVDTIWNLNKETVELPSAAAKSAHLRTSRLSANSVDQPATSGHLTAYQSEAAGTNGRSTFGDIWFVGIVAGCSMAAIFGVIGAGYCVYKFNQQNRAAADVEYPAYGVVGPATKDATTLDGSGGAPGGSLSPSGDRKLAQSAQMYHYHHQKQQMIASEKAAGTSRHTSASDVESDDENEDGDYTVYECPGLAPTGEMEVKNPLFQDDITPLNSASPIKTPATATSSKRDGSDLK